MTYETLYPIFVIAIITAITFLLRALPFIAFGKRPLPKIMQYLAKVLPSAIMVILVIYCLRNIDFTNKPFGLVEISASILVVILHLSIKSMYLSIAGGTIFYMILLRVLG